MNDFMKTITKEQVGLMMTKIGLPEEVKDAKEVKDGND